MAEKIKEKPKIQIAEQVKEPYQPKKEGQSTFDKILESNRMMRKAPQQVQDNVERNKTETRVERHQDQGEKGGDSKKDEKERETMKEKAKEERKSAAEAGKRVVGKGQKKDGSGAGTGQGKGGKGQGFGKGVFRKAKEGLKKGEFTKAGLAGLEQSKFALKLKSEMNSVHLTREFIQKMVNQLVKIVKTGINKDGEKEIRLDLHERIFKGLRLRVALKDGKVSVHFKTSSGEVKELFANSSEDIQKQLEAKGISIREITVT